MGSFNHEPDMSTYNLQYNVTAFSIGGLSNIQHTLVISTNDYPNSTFINFDYAIYTYDYPIIALTAHRSKFNLGWMSPRAEPRRIQDILPLVESVARHLEKLIIIHPVASRGSSSDL